MSLHTRHFTPSEAAVISGIDIKAVNNAIDKRIITAQSQPGVIRSKRALSETNVLQVKVWKEAGAAMTNERRIFVLAEIERTPMVKTVKASDFLIIDVEAARKQIAKGMRTLEMAEADVISDKAVMGGEPVFKGTRIPVRLVASMLDQGATEAEILEGYPRLDNRRLEWARVWSAAHPPVGRPKTLLDKGAKLRSKVPLVRRPSGSAA